MSKQTENRSRISRAAAAMGRKGGAKRREHPNKSELARRAGKASGLARQHAQKALENGNQGVTWNDYTPPENGS